MKKPKLEADLDPPDNPHTRPGGTAAERAVAATKKRRAPADKAADRSSSRPGGYAAKRAVDETKRGSGR